MFFIYFYILLYSFYLILFYLVLLPVLPLKLVQLVLVLRLVIFADPAVCFVLGTGEEILLVFHRTLSDVLFSECYHRMETP